jgi:hypothetical protein
MNDDDRDHPPESRFERLRRAASEMLASENVRDAIETTKEVASVGLDVTAEVASRGGHAVTSLYNDTRNAITQEEAWEQMEQSITDLTDVARVQHAMILDLLRRVECLEAAARQVSQPGVA